MVRFVGTNIFWRYKRYHVSVLLAWLSVGLLAGLYAGQFIRLAWFWPVAVIAGVALGASVKSRRWYACVIVVLVGIILGLFRGSTYAEAAQRLASFTGEQVTLSGVISQDPILANGSNTWQAQLATIHIGQRAYDGEVYLSVLSDGVLKRGDTITVSGKAASGFGNFRLTMFRAELKRTIATHDPFLAARDGFAEATKKIMPEPEASLGLGFLVGQKAALPPDLTEQLKTVGLTHVIVASGYNLTILVRFARRLLARRSRYLALAGSLLLVVGFVLVSGFSPSMNRAAIVTFLTLVAWYYGRKFHPIKLILYVAGMSAFMLPAYVWSDIGWLLSFAAFTGVLVVAPLVTKLLYRKETKPPSALVRLIIETVSAEVMTLPIIVMSFGYVPVLALFANVLVAPVIPFAMFFTFVAGVAGFLGSFFAVLALPASIITAYVIAIVENLASPDWARFSVQLPVWTAALWYGLMFVAGWYIWRRRKVDLLEVSVVE